MKRNYKYTIDEQVEILYERMFKKRYSGNDKVFSSNDFKIHHDATILKNVA